MVGLEASSDGFSLDLVGCRPVLMLRLAFLMVQENTSPVAINPFFDSGSLPVHPDAALATGSRSIARRMSRNNFRGTATSTIWKTTCQECRTTFAPILISFSRNAVSVQYRTGGRQHRLPQEVAQILGEHEEVQPHRVIHKVVARPAGPFDGIFALLGPLLRRTPLVVEPRHPLGWPPQIGLQ